MAAVFPGRPRRTVLCGRLVGHLLFLLVLCIQSGQLLGALWFVGRRDDPDALVLYDQSQKLEELNK